MKKNKYLIIALSILLTSCDNSVPEEDYNKLEQSYCVASNEIDTHVMTTGSSQDISGYTFDYNDKVYTFDSADIDYIHYSITTNILYGPEHTWDWNDYYSEYTEEQSKNYKYIYDGNIDVKGNKTDVGCILDGTIITFLLSGNYQIIVNVMFNDDQCISVDLGYWYVYDPETIIYINNENDFMNISLDGGFYYLNADLDFKGIDFKPITFTGPGLNQFLLINPEKHVIKNITINQNNIEYVGIFLTLAPGYIDGLIIDNLNINVTGDTKDFEDNFHPIVTGGLIGFIGPGFDHSIIKDCHITGNINAENVNAVGGLIGTIDDYYFRFIIDPPFRMINCSFNGNITHTVSENYTDLSKIDLSTGGLVGYIGREGYFMGLSMSPSRYKRRLKGDSFNYPTNNVNAKIKGPKYVGGFGGLLYREGWISNSLDPSIPYFNYNFDNVTFEGELESTENYTTDDFFFFFLFEEIIDNVY